jgi:hypothetical protein
MIIPDRTGERFRINCLRLKANVIKIRPHLRACLLSSLFSVFLSVLFVSPASAGLTCKQGNVSKVLNAGTIVIPMNAPSGTVVSTHAPETFQMLCQFLNSGKLTTSATSTIRLDVTDAAAPGFTDVYKTAIDGLGIRYVFNAPACDASNLSLSNGSLKIPCAVSGELGGAYTPTDVTVTAIFVAYGAVKAGATTLSSIPVLKQGFESTDSPGQTFWGSSVYTGSATGTINTATCSVQTIAPPVDLPPIAVKAFSAGVGTVAGKKAFELDFTCSTGAQVSIVITDVVNPSNRTSTLTLSPESTAKGIGLQVL